jgi:Protein of unknown function (DUF805)
MLRNTPWFFFSFRGRIGVRQICLGSLSTVLICCSILQAVRNTDYERYFSLILTVIGIWMILALWVKRVHDCGFSGWTILSRYSGSSPFTPGDDNPNKYGTRVNFWQTQIDKAKIFD